MQSAEFFPVSALDVAHTDEVFATDLDCRESRRTDGERIRASADLQRNRSGYWLAGVLYCDTRLRYERRGAPASPHNAEPATRPELDDCFSLREFEPADEQQRPGVAADAGLVFLAKVSDLFGVALVFGL
jgi:uncharacterized caspase-like protein